MTPLLIDGCLEERDDAIQVTNPDDETVIATVARASEADVPRAVNAATQALSKPIPAHHLAEILDRVSRRIDEEAESVATLIATEGIKTIREARVEAARAANTIGLSAIEATRGSGETLGLSRSRFGEGRFGFYVRQPLGVIAGITPFNDPLNLVAHKVGPALAAGNAIIIKPDSRTPLSALRLADYFREEGLPNGRLQVLPGDGPLVGGALASHVDVAMVSFTGGIDAGRTVAATAGVKKIAMELGANNACIVHHDADIPAAIARIGSGMFWAAGQNCLHVQRVYAHESVSDQMLEGLVDYASALTLGPKLMASTDMGPLVNAAARSRVKDFVDNAVSGGASAVVGGSATPRGFEPTVLTDVGNDRRILTEEIYGPVTTFDRYKTLDEAIDHSNASRYSLAASVFTSSMEVAFDASSRLVAGGVVINDSTDYRDDRMPFGGGGWSGVGREGVMSAVNEMSEPKTVVFNDVASIGAG